MENSLSIKDKTSSIIRWASGLAFTFIIAAAAFGLSALPGLNHAGPLSFAIIIAVVYRQIWGYPEKLRSGIQFSSKRLLRLAIILYGLKLNMDVILHQGLDLLNRDAGTVAFSILCTVFLAKLMKADASLSLLLGIGTGVCGAAAIAAVSPILKAKDEDTASGAGFVALVGTVFAISYTVLRPLVPLTSLQYGIWSGVSLHEIAHVALAGAPAGQEALSIALLSKLGRVFLLIPLSFILMYWISRKEGGNGDARVKVEFPWFLIGFIFMSLFGSYVLGKAIIIPDYLTEGISFFTSFILTMAMIGLGLNVRLKDLRTKGFKPLLAMVLTSVILSILTYITL